MLRSLCILFALTAFAESKNDVAWKQIQSLKGDWTASSEAGMLLLTYTVISGGSTVVETMKHSNGEPDMITMYHRDGDALIATHYCSAGNQPRMKAKMVSDDGKRIAFDFMDGTNIKSADTERMQSLVLILEPGNHLTQEWTSKAGDKLSTDKFHLVRK